ncbi:unnamed protein product [Menidia menidia]|uniref:(Atlantic silverside) hypothetical protein n=1 Tax=Menidia menidia TaxID=238744 RepID=A0A8S4BX84_9TELE|nr:unnamed protein product [Menidia menidia]
MSGHNPETLFSFELLVEYIRLERRCKVSDELALGVRLLDFPTLLIYQPQRSGEQREEEEEEEEKVVGDHIFSRGKCCFFKMNMDALHAHLCTSPLYVMVLDVAEDTPRLVGSSLVSLSRAMDRIRQDVSRRGFHHASSHRERGLVGVSDLAGERIGAVSLSYKLACLGASLLPHITASQSTSAPEGQQQERVKGKNRSAESLPPGRPPKVDESDSDIRTSGRAGPKILDGNGDDDAVRVPAESQSHLEEDSAVFRPPHLYFCNTAQERNSHVERAHPSLNPNVDLFAFEDSCSEGEESVKRAEGSGSPGVHQKVTHTEAPETSGATPRVLRDALRQLPLLNALISELSQLSGQSHGQCSAARPGQAWVGGAEPAAGRGNTTRPPEINTVHKSRRPTGADTKSLHPPRSCSTPIYNPAQLKDNQEHALNGDKRPSKCQRKTLVYGTTKTFNLRLKQIAPLRVKRRECVELMRDQAQSGKAKGKTKPRRKTPNGSRRTQASNQNPGLNENIQTVMQSVPVESQPQEAPKTPDSVSGRVLTGLSQRELGCIRIPAVHSDGVPRGQFQSQSDLSEPGSDRDSRNIESSQSSTGGSPRSWFSNSSTEGKTEADYADDFDSLESDNSRSPEPTCSPEPPKAETSDAPVLPKLSSNLNSRCEGVQKRPAPLPVPVRAPSSPHRSLMGTHIIRPRVHSSAISLSSDDDHKDGSASVHTAFSRKRTTESHKAEQSSCDESFTLRSQRSVSTEDRNSVHRLSAESMSSSEAQEAEELEDELGSLDFRKEYKHISELVANKLPGYTM